MNFLRKKKWEEGELIKIVGKKFQKMNLNDGIRIWNFIRHYFSYYFKRDNIFKAKALCIEK